jgi:hypothetical protein
MNIFYEFIEIIIDKIEDSNLKEQDIRISSFYCPKLSLMEEGKLSYRESILNKLNSKKNAAKNTIQTLFILNKV